MAKLGDVIKISDADYTALKNAGSAGYVINGVRYYYNENNIYLTPSNGGGGGTATDVQINGTSITSSNVANILTQGTYNSSTNKIATMSDVCESITYSALKTLRDNSQLIPNKMYRITDYSCTTSTTNTSSAGHAFDIIVTASSTNTLNEEAYACLHSGDTYFSSCKLSAWKLKYCIDNDTTRFAWAKTSGGKGVIYYMKDEFDNEAPYDFKNILFTASGKYTNSFTFNYVESSTNKDASLLASKQCYSNIIAEYRDKNTDSITSLPFNIIYSTSTTFIARQNIFKAGSNNNTFGFSSSYNIIDIDVKNVTIGYNCYENIFWSFCHDITLGNGAEGNTFGQECNNISIGNSAKYNTFGQNCHVITIGANAERNTFNNDCYQCTSIGSDFKYNTIGNMCSYLVLGNYAQKNRIGNSCNNITTGTYFQNNIIENNSSYIYFYTTSSGTTKINYVRNVTIDAGCSYLVIYKASGTTSSSNYLQNVHIHRGITGTSSAKKTIAVTLKQSKELNVYWDGTNLITKLNNDDGVTANPSGAYTTIKSIGIGGTNYKISPTIYHNNFQIQFNTGSDKGTISFAFDSHENYQTLYENQTGTTVNNLWYTLCTYSNVANNSNNFGGITAGGAFYSNYYSKLCVIVKMYMNSTQMVVEYVNCSDGSYGSITLAKSNTSYFTSVSIKSVEIEYGE